MTPGDLDTGERLLTPEQVAAAAGISPRTLHAYLHPGEGRGFAPSPDGHVGRTPVWRQSTVDAWLERRAS